MTTIDEVMSDMTTEVDRCRAGGDRRGYFAIVYRAVTADVARRIRAGEFDDGPRMEHLDVVFARRWLDACDGWRARTEITAPWNVAFVAAADERPLIVQQVLVGINAHINLDLGIAAVDTAEQAGITLDELRSDFESINEVLADLIDDVQAALGTVSPWSALVDRVSQRLDEGVTGFAIDVARRDAWRFAERLAATPVDERPELVIARAEAVADLGRYVLRPHRLIRLVIWFARLRESHDLDRVMDALAAATPGEEGPDR